MTRLELNQSRLDTYVKCERRFFLQYIQDEHVPARTPLLTPGQEERAKQGELFHQYMEKALRGLPTESLLQLAPDPIDRWVEAALRFIAQLPTGPRLVEFTLSVPFRETLLTAKYDLLVPRGEKAVIIDWKTAGRPDSTTRWHQDMQHVVFPFVLAEAAPDMGWNRITPNDIEFIYWFAVAPEKPLRFPYTVAQHRRNREFLEHQIADILEKSGSENRFLQVADTPGNRESLCSHCAFMFHCERGNNPKSVRDLSNVFLEAERDRIASTDADLDHYEVSF